MTQTYFPFSDGAGANVDEDQWRKMARLWLPTGVMSSELLGLLLYADSTGMQVKVKTGRAWLRGHFYENDAEIVLPIGTSDPTNPRIDRVVIEADYVANTIQLRVLQGTPAGSPVAPSLTQTEDSLWQVSLGQVAVAAAAATIAAANVTDERPMMQADLGTLTKVKTADQSKTNTTMANDSDLWFWAEPGALYAVDLVVFYEGNIGGDIKFGWSNLTAATGTWGGVGPKIGAASSTDLKEVAASGITGTLPFGGLGVGQYDLVRLWATIHNVNAGRISLQFAQNTATGTSKVHLDSVLTARRVG